jgi:hypothetical protein
MRLVDWQLRYAAFMQERAAMPFAWGVNDCALFAADCVLAITGRDPAAALRGTYDDALGAARRIEELGGLQAAASAALGEPVAPGFASVGDVVLAMNEGRELLMVCNGTSAIGPAEGGAAALGMESAIVAWKV